MSIERTPEEIAAARLLADSGLVQRRLNRDLAEVAELGRNGVRLNPRETSPTLIEALRSTADDLKFDAPIVAATQTKRHAVELPVAERLSGSAIGGYLASASATVREGTLFSEVTESDGARTFVFRRQARETSLASVTLSAEVLMEPNGRTYLTAYGWPSPPDTPVHAFTGTAEDLLRQALIDLDDRDTPLDRPLLLLWGTRLRAGGPVGNDGHRVQVAEGIAVRSGELGSSLMQAESHASASGGDGWYAACLYRSLLENLFESYLGGVTFSLVDAEDIDDLDEELRENLPRAHAERAAVPNGVPEGHWWWRTAVSG
ncbi:hypothetical protein [Nocardiopsis lambiniae]|uniref:Uncharacterized protein n=1 Tax=Nocardiopsis lambiniae TaxID=3075539 RepID=A0ABU2MGB1_9ACTN|nr:hypothetical protein [Nocardiopsis sp. DSM 44743]MDT0331744.1 hypothetical protein [Nocardiopsis sp. DSM 44743]